MGKDGFMRYQVIAVLVLGAGIGPALAQVPPTVPATTRSVPIGEAKTAAKNEHAAAVADCQRMWDSGTHMTRQEWSRTCRRVQDRLQQLQIR